MGRLKQGLGRLGRRLQKFGQLIGDFIGRVVLTVFYFTILVPFGIGVRLFADPLLIKSGDAPYWHEHGDADDSLEAGKRQY